MGAKPSKTIAAVRREIAVWRESSNPPLSWRKIADAHYPDMPRNLMGMYLCVIYKHGREPKRPDVRAALGLPVTAPAPVCAKCGQVHVAKRCTQSNGKAGKKRTNWKRAALLFASVIFYQAKGN